MPSEYITVAVKCRGVLPAASDLMQDVERNSVAQTSAFEVCGSSRAMDQMKGVEKESVILPAAYN
jgi:hypothetical protein